MNQEKKITYRVSPIWVIGLLIVVGGLGGLIYYFVTATDQNERETKRLEAANKKAQTENATLTQSYSTAHLEAVKTETDAIKASMWDGKAVDGLIASLRPSWVMTSRQEETNSEFIHRRYMLRRGASVITEWPEILAAFKKM